MILGGAPVPTKGALGINLGASGGHGGASENPWVALGGPKGAKGHSREGQKALRERLPDPEKH